MPLLSLSFLNLHKSINSSSISLPELCYISHKKALSNASAVKLHHWCNFRLFISLKVCDSDTHTRRSSMRMVLSLVWTKSLLPPGWKRRQLMQTSCNKQCSNDNALCMPDLGHSPVARRTCCEGTPTFFGGGECNAKRDIALKDVNVNVKISNLDFWSLNNLVQSPVPQNSWGGK